MGIEGLLALVRHYGLTQTGARRYEGEAQRGRQAVSVSVSLELHLGQLEATVRVAPVDPSTGLMACTRAHCLGALSPRLTPTGDAALDEAVALVVPDVTVLGLLDADTRTELRLALASGEVVLEDGVFVGTFSPDLHSSESLEAACERLVDLAHTFSLPRKRWLENTLRLATRDLDPRVRNELHRHLEADPNLHAELELHRMKSREAAVGDEDTDLDSLLARLSNPTLEAPSRAAALPALLSHLSVAKVLACAQAERGLWPMLANYGSGEGFDMLLGELDKGLTKDLMAREPDPTLELLEFLWPSARRSRPGTAMPLAAMLQRLGHPGGLDMVSLLLDTKDQTRFFAALDALTALADDPDILENRLGERGSSRLASWLPDYLATRPPRPTDLSLFGIALAELSDLSEHLEDALGLLDLLAQRMGPDAEPDLLAYLDHPNDTLVHRAIELLGEVGQREAQLALEPLTSGLFRPSELKRLARSSLERLHERLGPLSEGGLALTDHQDGGLTLSDEADLSASLARYLADPDPIVQESFNRFAPTDAELLRLIAMTRADASLHSLDSSHAELLAQVCNPALDPGRRSLAFSEMLRRFPWSDTTRALPRIKAFFIGLSGSDGGAPFAAMLTETLRHWLAPGVDTGAAFALLETAWSVRPPLTPELARVFLRIIARHIRRETRPWLSELLAALAPQHLDAALLALDAHGATRPEISQLIGPHLRGALIERAPHFAAAYRRGAAFLELAATSLPPASYGHLQHFVDLLGELGDPESAPYLFTHIEHYDDGVREAVLIALGHCGTPDHIEYLEPQTSGLFRSSRIKQLAREAIAHIRERAGMKDAPGALSLADISPGGLSLPDSAKD